MLFVFVVLNNPCHQCGCSAFGPCARSGALAVQDGRYSLGGGGGHAVRVAALIYRWFMVLFNAVDADTSSKPERRERLRCWVSGAVWLRSRTRYKAPMHGARNRRRRKRSDGVLPLGFLSETHSYFKFVCVGPRRRRRFLRQQVIDGSLWLWR